MVAGAAYYKTLLEDMHTSLQGLDTSDYAWDASDAWTQARFLSLASGGTRHLEAWIDLGGITEIRQSYERHQGSLEFAARWVPDDDSLSQARFQAAARAARDWLTTYSHPSGARAMPTGMSIEGLSPDWIAVRITFDLLIPRGA